MVLALHALLVFQAPASPKLRQALGGPWGPAFPVDRAPQGTSWGGHLTTEKEMEEKRHHHF